MKLPDDCINEYQEIHFQEFGFRLPRKIAEQKAKNLLKLSERLIHIKLKGDK
ncbi:MAG: hypothetical protein HRT47_07465 [Candidatus Caenarcaniphilales bacterium]|nr:hypothetical protein [Candidatus Caenarcaniphilales bacterium]